MQRGKDKLQEQKVAAVAVGVDPRREELYARQIAAGTPPDQARSYADRFVFPAAKPEAEVHDGAGCKALGRSRGRKVVASPVAVAEHLASASGTTTKPLGGKARTQPDKKQLPLWSDLERAIPNHLARSSLFAPISRGARKTHDRSEIASREDVKILFTGKQLDMADCDVFMQALYEGHRAELGERVVINRSQFLSAIGRNKGRSDYTWLQDSFRRLFLGAIEIESKKYAIGASPKSSGLHLIDAFDYDPDSDSYYIKFDLRILALFHNREYALIDWEKRKQLAKRVDMAKWLQNYLASHEPGTHRISLKLLKEWMDYASPLHKFRDAVMEALGELERLGIVAGVRLETSKRSQSQVAWMKL